MWLNTYWTKIREIYIFTVLENTNKMFPDKSFPAQVSMEAISVVVEVQYILDWWDSSLGAVDWCQWNWDSVSDIVFENISQMHTDRLDLLEGLFSDKAEYLGISYQPNYVEKTLKPYSLVKEVLIKYFITIIILSLIFIS